jgi:transcriptional regulator with XRE-family HTH domain
MITAGYEGSNVSDQSHGIGAAVHRIRRARGESMRTVAAAAGVSQPFLSKLESGQLAPSIATLYALSDALGVSPSDLLPTVDATNGAETPLAGGESERSPSARLVAGGAGRLTEAYLFTAEAGDSDDVDFAHEGEEFVFVLEGAVVLTQDGRERTVEAGGSLSFDPRAPHRWSAPERARYLLVSTRRPA